jgi:outer membrane biosynthesis protein TonB
MRNLAILCAFAAFLTFLPVQAQNASTDSKSPEPASPKADTAKLQAPIGRVQILSDTEGADFKPWLAHWHRRTERTWDKLIPDEINPPQLKKGQVVIRFKVLPNGRLMAGSMVLEGRSGDVALDRAAWGALTGSNYPPLPEEFHGPYLELRALFLYNMKPMD